MENLSSRNRFVEIFSTLAYFAFIILFVMGCDAQDTSIVRPASHNLSYGVVPSDTLVPEIATSTFEAGSAPKGSLDWKKFLPDPGDQGEDKETCIAWALAYMKDIQVQIGQGWYGNYKPNGILDSSRIISPASIYNPVQAKLEKPGYETCEAEMNMIPALLYLNNAGAYSYKAFPQDDDNCTTNLQDLKARAFRCEGFTKINPRAHALTDLLNEMKLKLKDTIPLFILARYCDSLHQLGKNWSGRKDELIWNSDIVTDNFHAMLIVGYDNDKQAFLVINSFGPTWGNGGYFWLNYNMVQNMICWIAYTRGMTDYEESFANKLFNPDGSFKKEVKPMADENSASGSGHKPERNPASSSGHNTVHEKSNFLMYTPKSINTSPKLFWVKSGWYIKFNEFKCICTFVSQKFYKATFLIEDNNGKIVTNLSFNMSNRTLFFEYKNKLYAIKLEKIEKKGFNVRKKAAFFSYDSVPI